ncbi:MAG: redox-sensitive transcriptional activator SoxR [Pseudomonadota bacterium]
MPKSRSLSVGRVADRCGVPVSTLHFYEKQGLIHSSRTPGNQRRYGNDVIRRVSLIKAAQRLGISLQEIGEVFAELPPFRAPGKRAWVRLSKSWKGRLDARIAALEQLRDRLTGCIGCGCLSMARCPIYNPDDRLHNEGPGPVLLQPRAD